MFGKADLLRRLKVLDTTVKALTFRLELAEGDHRHDVHMRMVHLKRIEALERRTASCGIAYGDIYAQRAAEWGCTREVAKARMFAESLGATVEVTSGPSAYTERMKAAAERAKFAPGDRVGYIGVKGCTPKWYGIVCPRPAEKPQTSKHTGLRFIYVVADNGDVYGCYASRLVRA